MKVSVCVVVSSIICCAFAQNAALDSYRNYECVMQYLKEKGKFDNKFQTEIPAATCSFIVLLKMGLVNESYSGEIKENFPNEFHCLTSEMDKLSTYDLVLKAYTIHYAPATEVALKEHLNETRDELQQRLEEIASVCKADNKTFISIFSAILGIEDDTLKTIKLNYCSAKYVAQNKLLNSVPEGNELIPHNVDTESINCTEIIENKRNEFEKEFMSLEASKGRTLANCVRQAYEKGRFFDYSIASEVLSLNNLKLSKAMRESELLRLTKGKARYFVSASFCSSAGSLEGMYVLTLMLVAFCAAKIY
ncbi:hypothetical protein HA402_000021 [Bradysia odoriphaga]|nr:hypothetical protein HA402_000021 [Bradysia odoriphaga]